MWIAIELEKKQQQINLMVDALVETDGENYVIFVVNEQIMKKWGERTLQAEHIETPSLSSFAAP